MAETRNRLLVVDDQVDILDFVAQVADAVGFHVTLASSAARFREAVLASEPTLIILDLQMPGSDGIELLRFLGHQRIRSAVLISSGMDRRVLASAEQFGLSLGLKIVGALQKPVMLPDLEAVLVRHYVPEHEFDARELARAVDGQELVVHYQPKARRSSAGWEITGVEALVRWQHPKHGLVYPDRFIPLAEQSGLVGALTDWVLQEGVRQVAEWQAAGVTLSLAVNLSPRMVTDLDFPDRLAQLMAAHGVANDRLTLEITETAALEDPSRTMDILTRLRVKNFGLSLDDFGTGYSSLTQLYRMPFNELKIDKSLGMELAASREAQTMVRSLVDLAHNLGLRVCAEGVEDRRSLELLEQFGCDNAQGYYLSRPVPAERIPALLGEAQAQVQAACG